MIKHEKFDLILLLLVTLLLSTYLFFRTYVISLDGAFQYIPIAKDFVSGLYGKAFGHTQQPLYSLFLALLSQWVPDFELAGKLVASIFGILMILPVYFLGQRIFGQNIAFFSALFLVVHPYIRRFSADVLKESTYLFFLAMAVGFSWRTIQGEKKYPYLFIPLFSVLAYLVRPDGIEVLIIVFLYLLFFKSFHTPGKKWKVIFLLALSSFILFLPYLIHLRETTGVWTLSKAKTIAWFLGLSGSAVEISMMDRVLFTLKKLNSEIFSIYHPLYLFLLVIGLWKRRISRFKEGERFLLLFCAFHYVVLFLLVLNMTEWSEEKTIQAVNFSGRHVLPLLLFSIYWVGEGFWATYQWISKKLGSRISEPYLDSGKRSTVVLVILFILILAIVLPKTLKPQRYQRLSEKWAGIWIKNQSGKEMTIFTTLPRVAYYADGKAEYVDPKKDSIDKVTKSMTEKGTLYLVLQEKDLTHLFPGSDSIGGNFVEAKRYDMKGMEKIIVLKRVLPIGQ